MILKRALIKNFRSARNVSISFESQTAILGANGAGKSTILKALERFYGASTQVTLDDFFNRNVEEPIEIALTFVDFLSAEKELFGSRIQNGEMTVVRVFEAKGGRNNGRYFGLTTGHAKFQAIRAAENATTARSLYGALRTENDLLYGSLPAVRRADEIPDLLSAWELEHPEHCEPIRDDGQFLGFTNVGNGSLRKSTSFVFIPAVRDAASESLDGRGSAIAKLMELVVRSAIQKRKEIQEWQARVSQQYKVLTDPSKLTELNDLATDLSRTLQTLYDDTHVDLQWKPSADFEIPLPTAIVSLDDAGYTAPVELQGNGLQRAFILTLLQHLALATLDQTAEEEEVVNGMIETLTGDLPPEPLIPGLILAIEEPELYQHPTKQRHFAKMLSLLADGGLPGVATRTQVIFASHSPYFVCMDRFDQVRLARRHLEETVRHCVLREADLERVVAKLENAYGERPGTWTAQGLKSKLHVVTPELAEGFFAEVVLLVEGESDKAAIKAVTATRGIDLEAQGVAILQAGGKNNLDKPAAIFAALSIPTYVVWDSDLKNGVIQDERANRALQRLQDVPEGELVGAAHIVAAKFACFENNLESMLRSEIGDQAYNAGLAAAQAEFGIGERRDAIKVAAVMERVLRRLADQGLRSRTLDEIIDRALALKIRRPDRILENSSLENA